MTTFFGKYRGMVIANSDPQRIGRLQVSVPDVLGQVQSWAMPCVPYAGPDVGFLALPPIGAQVWVEFERGDPDYPIWTGCFWGQGQLPPGAIRPDVKAFKTDQAWLLVDDNARSLVLEIASDNGDVRIELQPQGIRLTAGAANLTLTEAGIDLKPPLRDKVQK